MVFSAQTYDKTLAASSNDSHNLHSWSTFRANLHALCLTLCSNDTFPTVSRAKLISDDSWSGFILKNRGDAVLRWRQRCTVIYSDQQSKKITGF